MFRRQDVLEYLLPSIPGASGRYGPGTGVGEDLLLFLLVTSRYPTYAHLPVALAHFRSHAGSITAGAFERGREKELAAAYSHAREYYLQEHPDIGPTAGLRTLGELVAWIVRSGGTMSYMRSAVRRVVS